MMSDDSSGGSDDDTGGDYEDPATWDKFNQEFDSDLILDGITAASSMIDAYLNAFYDITGFSDQIPFINTVARSLAASYVIGSGFQDFDQSSSTWEGHLYKWCRAELRSVQDGLTSIPGVARTGI